MGKLSGFCESLNVMTWHYDIPHYVIFITYMETGICRQHYSMNNRLIYLWIFRSQCLTVFCTLFQCSVACTILRLSDRFPLYCYNCDRSLPGSLTWKCNPQLSTAGGSLKVWGGGGEGGCDLKIPVLIPWQYTPLHSQTHCFLCCLMNAILFNISGIQGNELFTVISRCFSRTSATLMFWCIVWQCTLCVHWCKVNYLCHFSCSDKDNHVLNERNFYLILFLNELRFYLIINKIK